MKAMGYAFRAEGHSKYCSWCTLQEHRVRSKARGTSFWRLASPAEVQALTNGSQRISLWLTDLCHIAEQGRQQFKHCIEVGFPQKCDQQPTNYQKYWNVQNQLTIDDGLILNGCCLLIPVKLRQSALHQLHEAYHGTVRTKSWARLVVYWPGMDKDIDNITLAC